MKQQLASERNKLLNSVEKLLESPMILLGFVWLVLLWVDLNWGLSRPLDYISLVIRWLFINDLLKFLLFTNIKFINQYNQYYHQRSCQHQAPSTG